MNIKLTDVNVSIRKARLDDAPALVAAERATAQTPGLLISRQNELTLEAFERLIAELGVTGRYIVAEKIGKVVGHAFLEPMPLEAISHVFRLTIVVHPGHLSQGIGTVLMSDLIEWAKRTPHVGKIELLARATNERAIRLYSKLGFVEEGRFKDRVRLTNGKLVDDIAMAWFPKK